MFYWKRSQKAESQTEVDNTGSLTQQSLFPRFGCALFRHENSVYSLTFIERINSILKEQREICKKLILYPAWN